MFSVPWAVLGTLDVCSKIYRLCVAPAKMRSEMENLTNLENWSRRAFSQRGSVVGDVNEVRKFNGKGAGFL